MKKYNIIFSIFFSFLLTTCTPNQAFETEILEDTKLQLKTALSDVEDVDYAEAVTNMKKKLLSLEAAQSSFAQISRLSLFDYIGR